MSRKTYVKMFHEVMTLKTPTEALVWLQKETLEFVKKHPGTTLQGAGYIIRESLSGLLRYYPSSEKKLARLLGITKPTFGNFHVK